MFLKKSLGIFYEKYPLGAYIPPEKLTGYNPVSLEWATGLVRLGHALNGLASLALCLELLSRRPFLAPGPAAKRSEADDAPLGAFSVVSSVYILRIVDPSNPRVERWCIVGVSTKCPAGPPGVNHGFALRCRWPWVLAARKTTKSYKTTKDHNPRHFVVRR